MIRSTELTGILKKMVMTLGILLGLAVLVSSTSANAIGEGQIESGNFYRVRNITKGTAFSDPATADKCETAQFKMSLHNPGPGVVRSVNVRASLPTGAASNHVSTATVSGQNMQPATVSDTATLNLSEPLKITYVAGSTQLVDANGGVIRALPDGITAGGVNIGDVGVSLNEIRGVQFSVKVDCPAPPPPPVEKFVCEGLDVKQMSRTKYEFTARASVENATVQKYDFTAKNSANETVDTETVTTSDRTAKYIFEQASTGTYTVSVTITTDKGVTPVGSCIKQVTISPEGTTPPPPVTPSTTTPVTTTGAPVSGTLPATGPADIIGIFVSMSIASGVAFHLFAPRIRSALFGL